MIIMGKVGEQARILFAVLTAFFYLAWMVIYGIMSVKEVPLFWANLVHCISPTGLVNSIEERHVLLIDVLHE